jgi:hypothetical protein
MCGAAHLLRRDLGRAALLLLFPAAYVGYMSTQSVMVVRNTLVVVPFLAVLAARGAGMCRAAVARFQRGPALVTAATAAPLAFNAAWLISAGASCTAPSAPAPELLALLAEPSTPPCALSPRVRAMVGQSSSALPASVARAEVEAPVWVAFSASEVRAPSRWTANRPDYLVACFGPREVNLTYYPSWMGRDHVLVMRAEDALPLNLPLDLPKR